MEIYVQLIQQDENSCEQSVLAEGKGDFLDGVLIYSEKNSPSIKHEIIFHENSLVIKRHADIESETYLRTNSRGVARVMSPYGVIMLGTVLEEYKKNADSIFVKYSIYQENQLVNTQTLVWKLKGLGI